MSPKNNEPKNGAETNGNGAMADAGELLAALGAPTLNAVAVSQKLALETTKFWTRRLHAYADQMAILVQCTRPDQLVVAQAQFIERMQEDYVAEREAMAGIFAASVEDRPGA